MVFVFWFFYHHSDHMTQVSRCWPCCDFYFPKEAYCCFHCRKFHINQCAPKYLEVVQCESAIWLCKDRISNKTEKKKKWESTFPLPFSLISILKSPGESLLILKWQICFRFNSSLPTIDYRYIDCTATMMDLVKTLEKKVIQQKLFICSFLKKNFFFSLHGKYLIPPALSEGW